MDDGVLINEDSWDPDLIEAFRLVWSQIAATLQRIAALVEVRGRIAGSHKVASACCTPRQGHLLAVDALHRRHPSIGRFNRVRPLMLAGTLQERI